MTAAWRAHTHLYHLAPGAGRLTFGALLLLFKVCAGGNEWERVCLITFLTFEARAGWDEGN